MDRNKIIIVCLVFLIILFIVFIFNTNEKDNNFAENISAENEVYNMMMNTLTRDITNVVETEMTKEEQEFYNKYLKNETSEEIFMISE